MFENSIKRGEISSAQIVDELEKEGFNLHGVEREKLFVHGMGMKLVRGYPIGRNQILIFKKKDWKANRHKIVGKTSSGYPLLHNNHNLFSGTHDRRVDRPTKVTAKAGDTPTIEQKVDLLLWAMDQMLQQQSDRA